MKTNLFSNTKPWTRTWTITILFLATLLTTPISVSANANPGLINWTGIPKNIAKNITSAGYMTAANSVLFFTKNSLLIYELDKEATYRHQPPQINALAPSFAEMGSIDAMIIAPNTMQLEVYHLNEMAIIDLANTNEAKEYYADFIPVHWNAKLDAACYWTNDQVFFFRKGEYLKYDYKTNKHSAPKSYVNWQGWPSNWSSVDAVVTIGQYVYFFNKGSFLPYDKRNRKFLSGYPKKIGGNASASTSLARNKVPKKPKPATQKVNRPAFSQADMRNMVEVTNLGVGFDAVYVDPQDLTKNSVRNSGFSRPKILEFVPNPNAFINMSSLGSSSSQTHRRNLPVGVFGDNHARFEWSDETRWAKSASEFQKSFSHAYTGGVGVPGIASVSGSVSFEDVKRTTRSSENIYVYQDGFYRGHSLTMDKNYSHQVTDQFRRAVKSLGNSSTAYDQFIKQWGTHFSTQAMLGAKCSYRFKLSKSAYEQRSESRTEFEVNVSATIKKVQADFGTSQGRSKANKVSNEIGASETKFISYGGSGATDFGRWSEHATNNRTLIDVKLTSLLDLFNSKYFPNDAQIRVKYQKLNEALQRYFSNHGYRDTSDPRKFFKKQAREFKITATVLEVQHAPHNQGYYSGKLYLKALNGNLNSIDKIKVLNIADTNYKVMRSGQQLSLNKSTTVSVSPRYLKKAFVAITGELNEVTHHHDRHMVEPKSMGNKTAHNLIRSEKIMLAEIKRGATKRSFARYAYSDGDVVLVRFEVKRIR
jgi:MAC/Perforin domain.